MEQSGPLLGFGSGSYLGCSPREGTHSVSDLGFHSVPEAQGACLGSGTRSSLLSWGGPRRESGGRGLRSLRLWG